MRALFVVLSVCAFGCGGASQDAILATPPVAAAKPAAPVAPVAKAPSGALFREDVSAVVDQGMGQFLRRVEVEPRLVGGQFRGWSIVNLKPSEFWAGVDLKPGDVVTRVNDLPIERETEAFDAFESLKKADKLVVAYERDGKSQRLEYRIVARGASVAN